MGRSYMPKQLFQNIPNAQLHNNQEDENNNGNSSSSKYIQRESRNEAQLDGFTNTQKEYIDSLQSIRCNEVWSCIKDAVNNVGVEK